MSLLIISKTIKNMYRVIFNNLVQMVTPDYNMARRSYYEYVRKLRKQHDNLTQVLIEKDGLIFAKYN